jgi:hypothetical protein
MHVSQEAPSHVSHFEPTQATASIDKAITRTSIAAESLDIATSGATLRRLRRSGDLRGR